MNLEIIPVYKNLNNYVEGVESGTGSIETLWYKYAIEPYWKTLCRYAPYDLSDRKPEPVTDIPSLKRQLDMLDKIDLSKLKAEFERVASALPDGDDDPIYIALYPLSDDNFSVKKRQNGVVGTSIFGNMIIRINPLADNFREWIPYVFAHEYHHAVWGNYWYFHHSGELENRFIDSLIIDGEADGFALSLYPTLRPKWLFDITEKNGAFPLARILFKNSSGEER